MKKTCPVCGGSGNATNPAIKPDSGGKCPTCKGEGRVEDEVENAKRLTYVIIPPYRKQTPFS